jgi:hypothetical protein
MIVDAINTAGVRWTGHFYASQEVAPDGFECSLRYTTRLPSGVATPDRAEQRNTTRIVPLDPELSSACRTAGSFLYLKRRR